VALPIIAIVGRPNVGKSTLFNRLAGRRIAVVSDIPGTTRDRVSSDAEWGDHRFMLVDTGGIDEQSTDALWGDVRAQTARALEDADAVVLVADASTGVTAGDEEAADLVRRSGKPAILAANKADNREREMAAADLYALGIGDPIPISAYHDAGITDLMQAVIGLLPEPDRSEPLDGAIRIAIAGRTNVGKSALFNAITGESRAIVSPIPGTTRDAVDSPYRYGERDLLFIDTAGLRRRGRTEPGIEKYSALRTIQAIERSYVVLLVMDASEILTAQDTHIAGYAEQAARAVVIVVNKWDLAPGLSLTQESATQMVRERLKFLEGAPVCFTSALNGSGLDTLLSAATDVYDQFARVVPHAELRRVVMDAMAAHPPPTHGRRGVRLVRVQQERARPPTFAFHMRGVDLIHFTYRRYLENRLRDAFGFEGTPLKLEFRP
jgi:GTPase